MDEVVGLLLAAGAGRRMGRPKALVDDWLVRSVATLRDGGAGEVLVVLGAAAEEAAHLLPDVPSIVATDWADGMGASLRAGLTALSTAAEGPVAAVVTLVDLPDVDGRVVARLLERPRCARTRCAGRRTTGRRATRSLLGRDHWGGVAAEAATATRGRGPTSRAARRRAGRVRRPRHRRGRGPAQRALLIRIGALGGGGVDDRALWVISTSPAATSRRAARRAGSIRSRQASSSLPTARAASEGQIVAPPLRWSSRSRIVRSRRSSSAVTLCLRQAVLQ